MAQDISIAVLTDVHGNAFAAEEVIADIRKAQPDIIVNLGDQVWGQANPAAALELQLALNAVEVRGNNDERLILPTHQLTPAHIRLQAWLAHQLPERERERLATLPLTALLAEESVLAAHGTPASPWDSLLFTWDGQAFRQRSDHEVRERLDIPSSVEVVVVGHMHREEVRMLDGRLLINVGPLSFQNDGDPRARWALLTRRNNAWSVRHRRVAFNYQACAAWIRSAPGIDVSELELHLHPVTDPLLVEEVVTAP
ncbi:MAG: metallophosphoesterase [Deinococcus sp.]|nr:metallophosphoesterase [Deinococcus sp.]